MAVLQTCNCGGRARRHRGLIVLLLQLITRAVIASDAILPLLDSLSGHSL
jgi:hypothetical protein